MKALLTLLTLIGLTIGLVALMLHNLIWAMILAFGVLWGVAITLWWEERHEREKRGVSGLGKD